MLRAGILWFMYSLVDGCPPDHRHPHLDVLFLALEAEHERS